MHPAASASGIPEAVFRTPAAKKDPMKTIVLDDDPTGTQSVTDATVLLQSDADAIFDVLSSEDAVYVQTNSRALPEHEAVAFVERVRADGLAAAERLGVDVRFVLRGDSTLRGHVFAETEVLLDDRSVVLFVPSFPDGGRTTLDGVHYVRIDGIDVPAHESEYAADPVFPFSTGVLADYVAEKSSRPAVGATLSDVREGRFADILASAAPGSVIVPDAVTNDDIHRIALAADAAARAGTRIVVRSASPLAAELAGVVSAGLLQTPIEREPGNVLLVCGSHTDGASAQIAGVIERFGDPAIVSTELALDDAAAAGHAAAAAAESALATRPLAFVMTERKRSAAHGTLDHGERVMAALTTAVGDLQPHVTTVISKGGITSAEVATSGLGARRARVLGQVLPGISVWQMTGRDGRSLRYVVVPGNVGGPDALLDVLDAVGLHA